LYVLLIDGAVGSTLDNVPVIVSDDLNNVPSNGDDAVYSNLYVCEPDVVVLNVKLVPVPTSSSKVLPSYNDADIRVYPPLLQFPFIV